MEISRKSRWSITALLCISLLTGCASVGPGRAERAASSALADPRETFLGRHFLDEAHAHGESSAFHVISAGVDGFVTRVQMIRQAERTLDLQYFIFRGDETGRMITDELLRAADRGVRVRVLVDDGDTTDGDERILKLDGTPNIQVRVFNPFDYRKHNRILRNLDFAFHKSRLDYRMHNKLMVADNAVALIGGRNIGNQYFQLDPASQFADDDVFTAGPIVQQLSHSFDDFWNSDMSVPAASLGHVAADVRAGEKAVVKGSGLDYLARVESGEPYASLIGNPTQLVWATVKMIYDSPDKRGIVRHEQRGRLMTAAITAAMRTVESELLLASPYFVPTDSELDVFKELRLRDATVRVLTNSLESAPDLAAQSGYAKLRVPLLEEGIHLYEIRSRLSSTRGSGQTREISRYGTYALHAKLYLFDRRRVFVGSWNCDPRSANINTEIGVLIDSPEIAAQLARRFSEMIGPQEAYQVRLKPTANGQPGLVWDTEIDAGNVELTKEPTRGWWRRQQVRLLALFPLKPEL